MYFEYNNKKKDVKHFFESRSKRILEYHEHIPKIMEHVLDYRDQRHQLEKDGIIHIPNFFPKEVI